MKYEATKLTAAALVLALCSMIVNADPVEWTADPRDPNHYYEVFAENGITWNAAQSAVVSPINLGSIGLRGYLATLTSKAEDAFVDGLRQDALTATVITQGQVWIGGSQATGQSAPGGGWQWVNGEGAIPGVDSTTPYANWGDNDSVSDIEPNDGDGTENNAENHLALGRYGLGRGWNDEGTAPASIGGYIVEYEIVIEARDDPSSGEIKVSSGVLKKIDVLANDMVPAGVASVTIESSPDNGGTVCVQGEVSTPCEDDPEAFRLGYTSLSSFEGTETFQYRVTDNNGAYAIATVTVTVSATEAVLDTGPGQLIFNQAINPVVGGNNPLTAAYTEVLNGGEVTITCCTIVDWREYAGGGGKEFGNYLPAELDVGYEISQEPSCLDMPQQFKNPYTAILRPWQRGVPRSQGIPNNTMGEEHVIGVCGIQATPVSRGVVFSAEQAENILGFKLDYSEQTIRYRPYTAGVSLYPDEEVDAPFVVPWSAETDESKSGKRFSDNLMAINIWHDTLANGVKPNLSRLAAAIKDSIEVVRSQNCGANAEGFLDDLKSLVQSAKKDIEKKNGNPQRAVATLDEATRLALLIDSEDDSFDLPSMDPYENCPDNPQGLFVGRLMALKFGTCSKQLHPTDSASTCQGACIIEPDIRGALPVLPGFETPTSNCPAP